MKGCETADDLFERGKGVAFCQAAVSTGLEEFVEICRAVGWGLWSTVEDVQCMG